MKLSERYFVQIQISVFFATSALIFGFLLILSHFAATGGQANYLVSLYGNSTAGCSSFNSRQNNILVLGDSHAYVAFDFYKLSQLTGTEKISSCTMGGLYFETLTELVEGLVQKKNFPANLIYGLSLRQFTSGQDQLKQMAEHRRLMIEALTPNLSPFFKIKKNVELSFRNILPQFSLVNERDRQISYWQPVFSNLPSHKVEEVYEKLDHPTKDNWQKYFQQLKFLKMTGVNVDRFCHAIRGMGTKLFLVDIPESPFLQSQYTQQQRLDYEKVIAGLSQCAAKVVRLSSKEWGLDGRFFLNRGLKKRWNFDELYAQLNQAPADLKLNAFDLDHMNLVGAQIFTEKVYQEIKDELKYAF